MSNSLRPHLVLLPICTHTAECTKLKLQYFGHLMRRVDSLEKTLMLGGIGCRKRRGRRRMWWLDGISDLMDVNSGSWWWTGRPGVLQFMGSQRVGHDWATELNWRLFLKNLMQCINTIQKTPCISLVYSFSCSLEECSTPPMSNISSFIFTVSW